MDIPADLEITIADIRSAGHCARLGLFFHQNGLRRQYHQMIKGGTISAQELAATGDPRAIRVVELKIKRQEG